MYQNRLRGMAASVLSSAGTSFAPLASPPAALPWLTHSSGAMFQVAAIEMYLATIREQSSTLPIPHRVPDNLLPGPNLVLSRCITGCFPLTPGAGDALFDKNRAQRQPPTTVLRVLALYYTVPMHY